MAITPTNTTNLEFAVEFGESAQWQDTAQTTAATTSDPLGSWEDQSANGYDLEMGTTPFKPVVGSNAITFDGSNDSLENASLGSAFDSGASFACYIVIDPIWGGIPLQIDDDTTSERIYLQYRSTDKIRLYAQSAVSGSQQNESSNAITTGLQVWCLKFDGSNYVFYVDSVMYCTLSALGTAPSGLTHFKLAGDATLVGTAGGDVVGCYVYSTAHNDTDREAIEDELTAAFISSVQELTAPFYDPGGEFYTATVANDDEQDITVPFYDPGGEFYTATVANDDAQDITAPFYDPGGEFYTATIENVAINTIIAPFFDPGGEFYTATVVNDDEQDITVPFYDPGGEFYTAVIANAGLIVPEAHTVAMVLADYHTAGIVLADYHTCSIEVE